LHPATRHDIFWVIKKVARNPSCLSSGATTVRCVFTASSKVSATVFGGIGFRFGAGAWRAAPIRVNVSNRNNNAILTLIGQSLVCQNKSINILSADFAIFPAKPAYL
jgi:hypothetical protein